MFIASFCICFWMNSLVFGQCLLNLVPLEISFSYNSHIQNYGFNFKWNHKTKKVLKPWDWTCKLPFVVDFSMEFILDKVNNVLPFHTTASQCYLTQRAKQHSNVANFDGISHTIKSYDELQSMIITTCSCYSFRGTKREKNPIRRT